MQTKLSQEETKKVLERANLPGSVNRDLKFAAASKSERQITIKEGQDKGDKTTAAVIEIQRVWRGYNTRCKLFSILHPSASVMSTVQGTRYIKSPAELSDVRTPTPSPPHTTPQPESARQELSSTMRKYKLYCERAAHDSTHKLIPYSEFCALLIQHWWRNLARSRYPRPPPPTTDGAMSLMMSTGLSSAGRSAGKTPGKKSADHLGREEASKVIQRAWRRHIDIQVYRYYRDLINFKNRGDPGAMLRCINPKEAQLLDSASGVHIKFRLAGEKFPPNIYYKIFTHRNVADLCAFAPRDYTRAANKRVPEKHLHNRGYCIDQDNTAGWYQRWENNGWRLVSDRLITRVDQDPVVFNSAQKQQNFSHNKLIRKADLEKRRKRRKIEWMKKMYKEGMLKSKTGQGDPATEHIVQTVAEGMMGATDAKGADAVEDWEVDELLEWTSGLNFDMYLTDWKELATSAASESFADYNKYIPDDPFSLSLEAS